eukprot:TRINITY_DN256_c0_g2_i8.p2 TRINITY_DN256_c0_g2~~TRINITY_DN256_c0_g2_i8.p2  ORF type:complete len:131 (-),score=16.22 TRINITY_DN256_c0_g2_i8:1102-1494(-)
MWSNDVIYLTFFGIIVVIDFVKDDISNDEEISCTREFCIINGNGLIEDGNWAGTCLTNGQYSSENCDEMVDSIDVVDVIDKPLVSVYVLMVLDVDILLIYREINRDGNSLPLSQPIFFLISVEKCFFTVL